MTLETWIIALLEAIKEAGEKDENFDLHLEKEMVKEIVEAYDTSSCIEIFIYRKENDTNDRSN